MKIVMTMTIAMLVALSSIPAHAQRYDSRRVLRVLPEQVVDEVWHFSNYKRCTASTEFKLFPKETAGWPSVVLERRDPTLGPRGGPAPSVLEEPDTATVQFGRKHLAKLEAAVRFLKKCRAYVWDRNRDKYYYLTPKEMKEME
jgi:hypothetical protein